MCIAATISIACVIAIFAVSGEDSRKQNTNQASTVPQVINYQGKLTDSEGELVSGVVSIQFSMYNAATGGTSLWTETQSCTLTSGLFNVLLGSVNPIPASVFDGGDRWLGITVGTDSEMTPRQKVASVGYACLAEKADDADNLGGQPASSFVTQSQGDARYVNETGPDEMSGSSGSSVPILEVTNDGGTYAHGVMAHSGTGSNSWGMYSEGRGSGGGVCGIGNGWHGVYGECTHDYADHAGVYAKNAAGGWALYAEGKSNFTDQISSTISTGTAPLNVTSTTLNTNLNADMVDGQHASAFLTPSQGDDRYVNEDQANSVTSEMVVDETIHKTDVSLTMYKWHQYNVAAGTYFLNLSGSGGDIPYMCDLHAYTTGRGCDDVSKFVSIQQVATASYGRRIMITNTCTGGPDICVICWQLN